MKIIFRFLEILINIRVLIENFLSLQKDIQSMIISETIIQYVNF
jgi:hypothetical protein